MSSESRRTTEGITLQQVQTTYDPAKPTTAEDDSAGSSDQLIHFERMVNVGVPPDAVRQKMFLHGFDKKFVDTFLEGFA